MRYTVVWTPRAEATLANLWIHASDRQAVADASDRIDAALADEPESKGRPAGKFFIREDPPLAALYHVVPEDRMVRVISVKRM
jgi:hypothetical protein